MVSKYYGCSLYDFCSRYFYDTFFLEIVKQVTKEYNYNKQSYLEVEFEDDLEDKYYQIEQKFSYGVDNRNVVERVVSLGVNWVIEDVIVHKSSSVFILTGCDNTRDLLTKPVTNTPDIRYVGKGDSFYVEVCSDFTQFMQKNKRYDIRKLKYYKLEDLKKIENTDTLLLFIDAVNRKYYMTWFVSRGFAFFDKYSNNTVTFEFNENVQFKDLMQLFEYCKSCQPDTSLYSNFNVEEQKKAGFLPDIECDEYWENLFKHEPAYVKTVSEDIFLENAFAGDYPYYDEDDEDMGSEISDEDCPEVQVHFEELSDVSEAEMNEIFKDRDNENFFSSPFDSFDELPF